MDLTESTRFEDLSVELIIEIFEYFTANELYFSFSQLNIRLNSILKSLPNLLLITEKNINSLIYYSFFQSFKSIRVNFNYISYDAYCKANSLEDECRFLNSTATIEQFIGKQKHSGLRSIVLWCATSELAQSIFIGEYPYLRICHLDRCQPICLPSKPNVQLLGLRQLKIRLQHGRELEKLLSICPSLISFDFSCYDPMSQLTLENHYFPSMKYLRLSYITKFLFYNGQFEQFLSVFPNLIKLHLVVRQCKTSNETIDFVKIANYFHQELKHLKTLYLQIYMTKPMRYSLHTPEFVVYADLYPLFKCFYKCQSLLLITSYNFGPNRPGYPKYVRPS